MDEYTFYLKSGVIVAMSHVSGHGGYTFLEGSLFKNRNPFLMGNGFSVARSCHCDNQKELKHQIKQREKKLCTSFDKTPITEKRVTSNLYSEEYTQFREKYGK